MKTNRRKRIHSVKVELVSKSREAALASVQVFNNPLITFKSEMFIVNMVIAWTYLLHAHYRDKGIEYRYVRDVLPSGRRRFDTTSSGAHKYWDLERCLNVDESPVDRDAANNLRFLIGLRHEIEHQMTTRIDDALSARFQACCLNYNETIKQLFGDSFGIDRHLSFSLQFSSLSEDHTGELVKYRDILPAHISSYIDGFDGALTSEEFNSPKYAYRVIFTPKTVNHVGQADKVIEFIKPDTEAARGINATYAIFRDKEKVKYRASTIVKMIQDEGYSRFTVPKHAALWQQQDAKNPAKNYGIEVEGYWYWYENWLNFVRQYCKTHSRRYK